MGSACDSHRVPCSCATQAAKDAPDSVDSLKASLEERIVGRRNACNEDGEDGED